MKKVIKIFSLAIVAGIISCNGTDATQDLTGTNATANADQAATGGQENVLDNESEKNVVKIAIESKDHTTLVAAIKQAELVTALSNAGPFTVFAPTNAAFTKLGTAMLNEMNSPANKEKLNFLLQRHIFKGSLDKEALIAAGKTPPSMNGNEYLVRRINNKWYIGNAHPTQNPLFARNGMFYVVDAVIE